VGWADLFSSASSRERTILTKTVTRFFFSPVRVAMLASLCWPCGLSAQWIHGRVIDESSEKPVQAATVYLRLGSTEEPMGMAIADAEGRFSLKIPREGEYRILAESLGYLQLRSPLLALPGAGSSEVQLELRPEPLGLDPVIVTVRNEAMEAWFRRERGINPHSMFGFRALQGERLEEAKARSDDNTNLLRWLYIPISHGREVCVGVPPRPPRRYSTKTEKAGSVDRCGNLFVDGMRVPNEHIEAVDKSSIIAVITFPGTVHMFTRDFDWR
jgi:hypothetical protein